MNHIKLLSLNVALFQENNHKLAAFLAQQQPDVVCLQEVSRRVEAKTQESFISQNAIDEATTELPYAFFAPLTILQGFKKKDFHGKEEFSIHFNGFLEYGNYIKSKFRIVKGQNVFVQNHFSYVTDWSDWPTEDYRAVQVVDIELPGAQPLRVINYHGIWSRDKQGTELTQSACQRIYQLATEVNTPVVICGDFNLFPDTGSMRILNKHFVSLVDKYNIQTTRPQSNELSQLKRNVVDYIFVSKDIPVDHFEVIKSDVSDHLPLVLEFSL